MPRIIAKPYWYLRHGETDWNLQGLAQGRSDIPLNETGLQQAARAGDTLAALFSDDQRPFDRIVSSPLKRALVTAQHTQDAIRKHTGISLPLEINDDLAEVCFGIHEGTPMGAWYNPWIEDGRLIEDGESFAELADRAISTINTELQKDGTPLFVAHGALFRGIRAGMDLPVNVRLANATPLRITPTEDKWLVEGI